MRFKKSCENKRDAILREKTFWIGSTFDPDSCFPFLILSLSASCFGNNLSMHNVYSVSFALHLVHSFAVKLEYVTYFLCALHTVRKKRDSMETNGNTGSPPAASDQRCMWYTFYGSKSCFCTFPCDDSKIVSICICDNRQVKMGSVAKLSSVIISAFIH